MRQSGMSKRVAQKKVRRMEQEKRRIFSNELFAKETGSRQIPRTESLQKPIKDRVATQICSRGDWDTTSYNHRVFGATTRKEIRCAKKAAASV